MRHLLRHLRGHVVLIWDNLGVHKAKLVMTLSRRVPRLHLEYLPAYPPELNPDQGVTIPRGVMHRPRAPQKTVMLMVETRAIQPTGD